jgi:hypothetical protein
MVAAKLANLERGDNQHAQICATSQDDAADLLNVSRRSVQTAKQVQERGAPELVAAVEQGKVSVSAAAEVATKPKDEQGEIVARGEKEILEAAKAIRAEKARATPGRGRGKGVVIVHSDHSFRRSQLAGKPMEAIGIVG